MGLTEVAIFVGVFLITMIAVGPLSRWIVRLTNPPELSRQSPGKPLDSDEANEILALSEDFVVDLEHFNHYFRITSDPNADKQALKLLRCGFLSIHAKRNFNIIRSTVALAFAGLTFFVMMADQPLSFASTAAIVFALVVIMGASTLSALSGVGKGIKWLSNINMGLSFFLLAFFLIFGSTFFGLQALFVGIFDYLINLPSMMFTVWQADGVEASVATQLSSWQGGWSVFYWAWWIAFAPFVGVFLARISRGRTVREYVLGAIIIPSTMCFVWFAIVGGTAIDLSLNGDAGDAITGAGAESQLFAMLDVMLSSGLAWVMALIVVILLLTYLVTSADSAVLIVNTINSGGDEGPKGRPHIIFWGAALALVVGALLVIGGLGAIQTAMVIGALPFSFVMLLMGIAVIKGIWRDAIREKNGVESVYRE